MHAFHALTRCRFEATPGRAWFAAVLAFAILAPIARGADGEAEARYRDAIEPLLVENCYGCHGDGAKKGGMALDAPEDALLHDRVLWWNVLKNVRAGLMPPAGKPRPSPDEARLLADWIKREVFGLDPDDPDPGRVTIRRLNRVEYRNTIRDLMGVDYNTAEEFPADDTGYGFDTVADVLTVSPLLLEKYLYAAEAIVAKAVPTVARVMPERAFAGAQFRDADGKRRGERISFYDEAKLSRDFAAEHEGDYRLEVEIAIAGQFNFDPGRCTVVFTVDDQERSRHELAWRDDEKIRFAVDEHWLPGVHRLGFEVHPRTPPDQKRNALDVKILEVRVRGPLDPRHWTRSKNYDRFFPREAPPASDEERRGYAREVLARFATRAFRRPVADGMVDRLIMIAEDVYRRPGKSFEEGAAQAMIAALASPRFLYRIEEVEPARSASGHARVDEYALASRLSYFLWSTMPDEELFRLAGRGELRANLKGQIDRMMKDSRSEQMVKNFVGQWLQARDVEGIAIDARSVLIRDRGEEKEFKQAQEEFRKLREARRREQAEKKAQGDAKDQKPAARAELPPILRKYFREQIAELDGPLRQAMRQEAEMLFGHIVQGDRSVLELLDADYTFVNPKLAKHYGIEGVDGVGMRRVDLPKDSPRGGVLTLGAVLAVTSNPTRTSPVKRGQFILDNILGTPAPPPPPDIPALEDAEKEFSDREPSMRELMEIHRGKPLCAACHARMDPLGLALDNFNAMGAWREAERKQPIDTSGKLLTGESFSDIRELKRVLKENHRTDFYRCLTEKLLTYALGRGLEYYDVEAVDQIVDRLDREQGRFSALLVGIIESAPFQKMRTPPESGGRHDD
jgi:mono/diheme cytochrome c family protein